MTPTQLTALRKQCKLTQHEFAGRLIPPVSRLTVCNWESGRFAIPADIDGRLEAIERLRCEIAVTDATPTAGAYEHLRTSAPGVPDLSRAANDAEGYRRLREHWEYPNHATVMEYKRMEGYFWVPEAFEIIAQLYPDVLTDPGEIDWAVLERTINYLWRNPNFGGFREPLLTAFHAKYRDTPKVKFPNGFAIVDNQLCFISEQKGKPRL